MRKGAGIGFTGEENLGFVLESEYLWLSGEKKVVLDRRDGTRERSGIGRKKSVTGNVTGTVGYLLLYAKFCPLPIYMLRS